MKNIRLNASDSRESHPKLNPARTYRVECDLYRDGDETEVDLRKFDSPQSAADFTRSWVAEQPITDALPRARMYRNEGKRHGVMLSVWRKPNGEIEERRNA